MKNLFVIILCIISFGSFAQGFGESTGPKDKKNKTEKLALTEGDYLIKSSKSFSTVALTMTLGLSTMYIGSQLEDPQPVITAGSIIAGAGLFFYLRGCSFLYLAGKKAKENEIKPQLGLAPSPDGIALVFRF